MIHRIAQNLAFSASRRVYAVLLAVLLNLALMPCSMALEVVEEGHDCCPPELNLELSECCVLDDVSIDKRDGLLDLWDSPDYDAIAISPLEELVARVPVYHSAATDPPDPPWQFENLQKLFCVYLN
jgi:hypothetical protein